jgi:hypothetical protein
MKWSHVFFAGCLWVLSAPAQAGEPASQKAENAALTAQAAALYDQGAAAYRNEKWPEARAAYLAAWALEKHWQIAGNLADAEMQMGLYRDAAEHAWFYRQKAPEDRHVRADTLLARAKARVLTVRIETEPPGADVWVDGQSAGRTPLAEPIFLEPGKHTVTARMASRPEAKVEIDKGAGVDEVVRVKVPVTAVPLTGSPAWRPPMALVIGSGVLAVAGIGMGIGLTVAAGDQGAAAQRLALPGGPSVCGTPAPADAQRCTDIKDAWRIQDNLSNAAMGGFAAGSVLALATGGLFAWRARSAENHAVIVMPTASSHTAGVIVNGNW